MHSLPVHAPVLSRHSHRLASQFESAFRNVIDGSVLFGADGVLPNGLSAPLVGDAFTSDLREQFALVVSPQALAKLTSSADSVVDAWAGSVRDGTVPTPDALAQLSVRSLTSAICAVFAPYILDGKGCPDAPALTPPGGQEERATTCLSGACRWPLRIGRMYVVFVHIC